MKTLDQRVFSLEKDVRRLKADNSEMAKSYAATVSRLMDDML